jgi:hypothetical protein
MTEAEWLECGNPTAMLAFLDGQASQRKLRLFAVACCRRIWPLLDHEAFRRAVELSERFAEGQMSTKDLNVAAQEARAVARQTILEWCGPDHPEYEDFAVGQMEDAVAASHPAVQMAYAAADEESTGRFRWVAYAAAALAAPREESAHQARILRCVFGNPFRGASIDPGWLTPTVKALAHAAYEERCLPSGELDSARLAVLADALEEAGCTEAAILGHLREPGPHVRGCHIVDLLLGRE